MSTARTPSASRRRRLSALIVLAAGSIAALWWGWHTPTALTLSLAASAVVFTSTVFVFSGLRAVSPSLSPRCLAL